jgi:phosphate transport system protein
MSHYEERLQHDRDAIRGQLVALGNQVADAVAASVKALIEADLDRCAVLVLHDLPINRNSRALDRACHTFVAVHLPSAGHLRFISAVLRANVAMERIGDYAVTIAREAGVLGGPPSERVARDLALMSDQSVKMLRQALQAFDEQSVDLARGTMAIADQVDRSFAAAYADLVDEGDKRSVEQLFALLNVFGRVERVSDQAKNLCEEVVFAVTGQGKAPKRYRVLFLDTSDDGAGQLAAAHARRAFPDSGHFESAGWDRAGTLDPTVVAAAAARGLDLGRATPRALAELGLDRETFHVWVALAPDPRAHVGEVPFRTSLLTWPCPAVRPDGDVAGAVNAAVEAFGPRVRQLMELMRGEGAI